MKEADNAPFAPIPPKEVMCLYRREFILELIERLDTCRSFMAYLAAEQDQKIAELKKVRAELLRRLDEQNSKSGKDVQR